MNAPHTAITLDHASAIAAALGPDWEAQDETGEYRTYGQQTVHLVYVGTDPNLHGAQIYGKSGGYQ